jgi:hypothetical protein
MPAACSRPGSITLSQPPDNRFLAVRYAAREDPDVVSLDDDGVRRFLELRDAGALTGDIATQLGISDEGAGVLVHADEAQALAHRIAIGEEPMYPAPEPHQQVVDERRGSQTVPLIVLGLVLAVVAVAALLSSR